jgi:hypothetical protein
MAVRSLLSNLAALATLTASLSATDLASAASLCRHQIWPAPGTPANGNESHQNPMCMPNGQVGHTVWLDGYNGWKTDGTQTHRASILVTNPDNPSQEAAPLKPEGVDKVNYTGHAVNGNKVTYSCDWKYICISNLDGTGFRKFDRPPDMAKGRFQEPTLDPTGQYIRFEWTKEEDEKTDIGIADICTMRVDGSDLHCANFPGYNKQPDSSPDIKNNTITYQKQCGKDCWQIWTAKIKPDGHIDTASAKQLTKTGKSNTDASWSPDGTHVVYSCGVHGGAASACIIDVKSGKVTKVDTKAPYAGALVWCTDGYFYFEAGVAGEPQKPTVICREPVPASLQSATASPAPPAESTR